MPSPVVVLSLLMYGPNERPITTWVVITGFVGDLP